MKSTKDEKVSFYNNRTKSWNFTLNFLTVVVDTRLAFNLYLNVQVLIGLFSATLLDWIKTVTWQKNCGSFISKTYPGLTQIKLFFIKVSYWSKYVFMKLWNYELPHITEQTLITCIKNLVFDVMSSCSNVIFHILIS